MLKIVQQKLEVGVDVVRFPSKWGAIVINDDVISASTY